MQTAEGMRRRALTAWGGGQLVEWELVCGQNVKGFGMCIQLGKWEHAGG
jgi:hypothetical protein